MPVSALSAVVGDCIVESSAIRSPRRCSLRGDGGGCGTLQPRHQQRVVVMSSADSLGIDSSLTGWLSEAVDGNGVRLFGGKLLLGDHDNRSTQVDKKQTEVQTAVRSPVSYRRYLEITGQRQ